MEFDDLRAFVAVAETRSVSQAARQLFLTQPAVSRRLQRLESSLGNSLVDRRRRPFTLTPAGQGVLRECRRVLHSIREFQTAIAGDGVPVGELKIGVAHALTEVTLTQPLDQLRRKFAKVDLRLTTGWSRTLLERVRSSTLDAAVILLPRDDVLPPGVVGTEIGQDQLVIVAARGVRRQQRKPAQLKGVNWILNPEGCGARIGLEHALRRSKVDMHVALETYNYDLQLNLVARNRGWSLVPLRILERSGLRRRLQIIQVNGLHFPMKIWSVAGEAEMKLYAVIEHLNRTLTERLARTRRSYRSERTNK
jgi:DNA-binding transcriptional LysR family regulator